MEIKASYDSMSEVPTGYESAYVEQDGKAVFSGGDFETRQSFDELHSKKQAAFNDYHEVKNQLKAFEGIDPKEYAQMQERIDVLQAKAKEGTDEETIAAIVGPRVERQTQQLNDEVRRLATENEALLNFKLNTEKRAAIGDILERHVGSDAMADAQFIVNSAIERQADGTYMSNGNAGFEKGLSVEALVMKALETRPYWKKQSTSGHGAQGSSSAGVIDKRQQFNNLLGKTSLSRPEQDKLNALALELRAEQRQGN